MNIFKKLFCSHNYEQIDWREEYDRHSGTRYSMKLYKCPKCGKEIWVVGQMVEMIA